MAVFNQMAQGAGAGAEGIVAGPGTPLVLAAAQILRITDLIGTYLGAGIQRIRDTLVTGNLRAVVNHAASGTIDLHYRNPIQVVNNTAAVFNLVVTETGAFANTLLVLGKIDG